MKKRYLNLLAALIMLAAGTSCGSDDSSGSSGDVSSASETTASAAATASVHSAAAEKITGAEAPDDGAPAVEQACKVLGCLNVEGRPIYIRPCGNNAVVQCLCAGENDNPVVRYYVVDTVNDKLLRTVDADNSREILLGTAPDGTVTAEIWKDWVNGTDDKQELVFYKPDGSRSAIEYNDDLSFVYYDPSGQLYDLSKGVAKIGSDGCKENIFDAQAAEETRLYDPSRNRAVVSYLADSFSRPTTLMLIDTSTGEEITELTAASDASVYGAGDYVVVSCIPDYDTYDRYISVYEKATGRLVWTSSEKDGGREYCCCNDSGYCKVGEPRGSSGAYDFKFLRVSDGAEGTLTLDIPDAVTADISAVTSSGRFVSAVTVGDAEKNDTRVRLVMIDPAQVNYDGEIEKCEPFDYSEKNNKCGEKFSRLRPLADKLEKKYGIRILLGSEVLDINDIYDPYSFVSAESGDGEPNDDSYAYTEEALKDLDEILGRYPADFFEQFRINGKGGLYIALPEYLSNKLSDTPFEAGGVTFAYGLRTVIAVSADMTAEIIDHEMLHAVESIVSTKVGEIDEDEWDALNPEGFSYTNDFAAIAEGDTEKGYIYGYDDDAYFYRDYSKVTSLEDRATLIEGLFKDACSPSPDDMTYIEDVQTKCPHLRAKYEYLAKWVSRLYGYAYWEKMLGIEL